MESSRYIFSRSPHPTINLWPSNRCAILLPGFWPFSALTLLGMYFARFHHVACLTPFPDTFPIKSPAVFRTTKNNHNILQGVPDLDVRLTAEIKAAVDPGLSKTLSSGPPRVFPTMKAAPVSFSSVGCFQSIRTNLSEDRS